jgi:BMFP domain-containing protein YqiC
VHGARRSSRDVSSKLQTLFDACIAQRDEIDALKARLEEFEEKATAPAEPPPPEG